MKAQRKHICEVKYHCGKTLKNGYFWLENKVEMWYNVLNIIEWRDYDGSF